MRKITLACFASILAIGVANASGVPCNGFEIKIKNDTADDLVVHNIKLSHGDIQPDTFQKLNAHSEQVFTVNNSTDNAKLDGEFEFHSISLPSKKVNIKYDLQNKDLVCYHNDKQVDGDYAVDKTRLPGHVTYTIGN